MFHREPYASQFALLHLVEHLKRRGLKWLDIQMLTPHLVRMGAHTVPRPTFLKLLEKAIKPKRDLFPKAPPPDE
jgi:leucyl/phenylalanyl-tRNA--protein transferase